MGTDSTVGVPAYSAMGELTDKMVAGITAVQAQPMIKTKDGYAKRYTFQPLDELVAIINEALAEHNCVCHMTHREMDQHWWFMVALTQKGGGTYREWVQGPPSSYDPSDKGKSVPQQWGGQITYGRRYALMSFFNIFPDEDDDASRAERKEKQAKTPAGWQLAQSGMIELITPYDDPMESLRDLFAVVRRAIVNAPDANTAQDLWDMNYGLYYNLAQKSKDEKAIAACTKLSELAHKKGVNLDADSTA